MQFEILDNGKSRHGRTFLIECELDKDYSNPSYYMWNHKYILCAKFIEEILGYIPQKILVYFSTSTRKFPHRVSFSSYVHSAKIDNVEQEKDITWNLRDILNKYRIKKGSFKIVPVGSCDS